MQSGYTLIKNDSYGWGKSGMTLLLLLVGHTYIYSATFAVVLPLKYITYLVWFLFPIIEPLIVYSVIETEESDHLSEGIYVLIWLETFILFYSSNWTQL